MYQKLKQPQSYSSLLKDWKGNYNFNLQDHFLKLKLGSRKRALEDNGSVLLDI